MSLGLPLVKRLVELHDGTIRAASRGLGHGATFEVRLPLAPQDVELPSLDPDAADLESPAPDPRTEATQRMPVLELPPEATRDDPA
jgi:hypothetical protein